MNGNWKEVTVGEIAAQSSNALSTGPFGSAISSKYFQSYGIPVIRGSNLSTSISEKIIDDEIVFISTEKAREFSRSIVKKGDLIFTCWGTINQIGLIDGTSKFDEYVISNKQMKLTPNPSKANSLFLYYLFSAPTKQQEILNSGIGSSVPGFNLGQLKAHKLNLPPLAEQQQIANILSTLDDKIALNRQINKTLEAMAQALFKSWFVDFEPVRAKIAALETGENPTRATMRAISGKTDAELDALQTTNPDAYTHHETTASLFPDALVESELGLVPKGWEIVRIDEILELAYGKALKATERVPGVVSVYGSGGVTGHHNEPLVSGPGIIIGRKGTVGSIYYEAGDFFPIDTVFYVIPKPNISLSFCLHVLSNLGLENMNTDAAVPGLNRNNVYRLLTLRPAEAVLQTFSNQLDIWLQASTLLQSENRTLATLRDTLLPKLLSGEIHLGKIE